MSDAFGSEQQDPQSKPLRLVVPTRAVNAIELELRSAMHEEIAMQDAPFLFVEDDGTHNADDFIPQFGRPFTLDEALAIGGIIAEPIEEKYRRQIVIARELGDKCAVALYVAACLIEGVSPLIEEK